MNIQVIQLTGDELVVARFRKERGALRFLDGARERLDPAAELATQLNAMLPANWAADGRVILAIPPGRFFSRELTLPMTDRKKIREILPLELKGETALESDQLLYDAVTLADGLTLAVWCRQEPLAEMIASLARQGAEPEIVTASLFAWDRLLPSGSQETVAIADGDGCAVYRDGQPVFFRAFGPGAAADQLQRTLAAVEVGKEIRIDRVLLHGRASLDQSGTAGAKAAPLPLHPALAAAFGDDEQAARDLAGAYAIAQAVAFGEPINFRSGPLAYTRGREQLRRKLRLTGLLAAAIILLLFGELGVRFYLVKQDLASLDASIRTVYREVFPNRKKPVDEVAELRAEIKRLTGSGASGSVLALLKGMALAKGEDVTAIYELEVDNDQVRGKGDARTAQGASAFKGKMAGVLSGVEVSEIKSRPDGTVGFSFRGTTREATK